jgi:hypothetical protein
MKKKSHDCDALFQTPIAALLRRVTGAVLAASAGAVAFAAIAVAIPAGKPSASEQPFLAENNGAMNKMMTDMAIKPTGDVNRDFVGMMVPHHQGAVDMAMAYLRFGRNEKLRRLAQEIIVTQQQEIAALRLAVGERLPPSTPSPTQVSPAARNRSMSHAAMSMPGN